jgi:tagaturonate reductase
MRSEKNDAGQNMGKHCGGSYAIQDDKAGILQQYWQAANPETVVHSVLSDTGLWNTDLTKLPGFEKAVLSTVRKFLEQSVDASVRQASILAA